MNPGYAAAHLRLGFIRQRRVKDELALENFTEAEDLYRALSDYEGITETLYQQANFLNRRDRAKEAIEPIDEAIDTARMIENRYQEIRLQLLQSAVLRKLEDNGSVIYSCGTCLDFYEKRGDLKIGHIGNMKTTAEILVNADKIITP